MEEKLKEKYNALLERYKKGSQYLMEHPEEADKTNAELNKIETELSKIIEAMPNMTEEEKTEGFKLNTTEVKTEQVSEQVESKQIVVKQDPTPTTNLSTFSDNWKIATQLAKSDIIPENYKNKPQNIIVAINIADKMNLDPFTVMQNMAIIRGKMAWSGSFARTLIERSGKFKDLELNYIGEKGKDSYGCYLSATRVSDGKKINGPEVTMALAKAEKWTSNSKWLNLSDMMLAYRCQSYFCRLHCPEAMSGIYTAEEIEDINTPKQSAPVDIL
jgi:hypothetical protein